MKKSLYALLVITFSLIGANALASLLDFQVNKVVSETSDAIGDANSRGDGGGGRACTTISK